MSIDVERAKALFKCRVEMKHFIAIRLAHLIGAPCNLSPLDEEMCEYCGNKNCPPDVPDHNSHLEDIACWERVLTKWMIERKEG